MRVLISVIVSLIFLNAAVLYTPIDIKYFNIIPTKKLKNPKNIDFNNSLAILDYNYLPFILNNNLIIVTGFAKEKKFLLTNQKSLSEIRTIANLELKSKILLDTVNADYKEVNASFKDFLNKKVDAIVISKNFDSPEIYNFKLKDYGFDFSKYFLVTSRNFIEKNPKLVSKINKFFEESFDFDKNRIYKSILITSLYLHKKTEFKKILLENYNEEIEKEEEPLIIATTNSWPPFSLSDKSRLYGIGIDFWKLIAKKAKIKYKFKIVDYWFDVLKAIKNKKADANVNTSKTEERAKYALFSKPYVSYPLAVICRNDENFNSINDIKTLAVGMEFTAEKLMKKHYPNLNYVDTQTAFDALKLVKEKKVDCAVDILPTMLWIINKNHLMNLQLAFRTPFKFNVQIMLRKDKAYLLPKINKAIDSISPKEKEKIFNTYIGTILVEKRDINWKMFILIILVIIMFVVVLIGRITYLSKKARHDPLTGILNRRGVLRELPTDGTILYLDIDHFKKINDTYGHEKGDEVLKDFVKILKETFRKNDIIGRWGGEEFVVILPKSHFEIASWLAERLRKKVEEFDFGNLKVTVSIGVSEFQNKKEFKKALEKADEALYEAKNSGRNQVKGKK